jgi:hypothetical protein
MAVLRIALGGILFWGLMLATLEKEPHIGVLLVVSSLFAWSVIALLDPHASWRRGALWVASGTATTLAVNATYWYLFLGQNVLFWDTRWSFG